MEIIGIGLCGYSYALRKGLFKNIKLIQSIGYDKITGLSLNKKRFLFNNHSTTNELSNDGSLTLYYNDNFYNKHITTELYNRFYYRNRIFENCIFLDKYQHEYDIKNQLSFNNIKEMHNLDIKVVLPITIKQIKTNQIYYMKTYRSYVFSENYNKIIEYRNNYANLFGVLGVTIFGLSFI